MKPDGTRITQFRKDDGTIEEVITIKGNTKESEKMKKLFDGPQKFCNGCKCKHVHNEK